LLSVTNMGLFNNWVDMSNLICSWECTDVHI